MNTSVYVSWGSKVSSVFLDRVRWLVEDLQIGYNTGDGMSKLMACIAWETGRTFSPSVTNMAGSGATGLIQFMPSTARGLDTTTAELAAMTAEDQLNYVWKYFSPYKGKLKELSDLYMAILWPKAVGMPETYVLWDKATRPTTYRQNSGLDTDRDGVIIKAEASAKLSAMLVEGMGLGNVLVYHVNTPLVSLAPVIDSIADRIEREARDAAFSDVPAAVEEAFKSAVTASTETLLEKTTPVAAAVAEATKVVVKTADTVTTTVVQPNTAGNAIKEALSGWQGNLAGVVAIVAALLSDPTFAAKLGVFTTSLATGNGRWGALVALLGAGLIAYRHRPGASV